MPAQSVSGPTMAAVAAALCASALEAVEEHPPAPVTVTTYVPAVEAMMLAAVAPVLHK